MLKKIIFFLLNELTDSYCVDLNKLTFEEASFYKDVMEFTAGKTMTWFERVKFYIKIMEKDKDITDRLFNETKK